MFDTIEASAPAFNSLSTSAAWPFKVAALSAVCVPAGVFTGAPRANSKSTISVWPFATALINAVKPFASCAEADAPAGWRVKVASAGGGAERRIAAWLGGSILASLGTFHEMWEAGRT